MLFKKFPYTSVKYGGNLLDRVLYFVKTHLTLDDMKRIKLMQEELDNQVEDISLKEYSCSYRCPNCGTNLVLFGKVDAQGVVKTKNEDCGLDIYAMECGKCHHKSLWVYGLAPAPVLFFPNKANKDVTYEWKGKEPDPSLFR